MYSSYCKKKELARQVFLRYSSKCSYLAQMIQHFLKFNFVRVFKKRDFGGFEVLGIRFLPVCEKGSFCASMYYNRILLAALLLSCLIFSLPYKFWKTRSVRYRMESVRIAIGRCKKTG